jgi:ligand-binding SRPBCC domain-containing protein
VPHFVKSVLVNAPIETVFEFHERDDALSLLSPAFPPVRVIRKHGGIEPGSWVELKVGPVHWTALHSAFVKNRFFEDKQVSGPFAAWIHRHEFDSLGNATRLTDRIEFRLPGGQLVNFILGWVVKIALYGMFRQRHQRTKQLCEEGLR